MEPPRREQLDVLPLSPYCRGWLALSPGSIYHIRPRCHIDDVLLSKCLYLLLVDYVLELCQNGELLTYIKKVRDPAPSSMENDITMLP